MFSWCLSSLAGVSLVFIWSSWSTGSLKCDFSHWTSWGWAVQNSSSNTNCRNISVEIYILPLRPRMHQRSLRCLINIMKGWRGRDYGVSPAAQRNALGCLTMEELWIVLIHNEAPAASPVPDELLSSVIKSRSRSHLRHRSKSFCRNKH